MDPGAILIGGLGTANQNRRKLADGLGSREASSRAGWRESLRPWGDERDRSLPHPGAI